MAYQDLILEVLSRLTAPQFAAIFLGLVIVLFYGVHFGGRRGMGREFHKLISLAISLGLALILAAASIGIGLW